MAEYVPQVGFDGGLVKVCPRWLGGTRVFQQGRGQGTVNGGKGDARGDGECTSRIPGLGFLRTAVVASTSRLRRKNVSCFKIEPGSGLVAWEQKR